MKTTMTIANTQVKTNMANHTIEKLQKELDNARNYIQYIDNVNNELKNRNDDLLKQVERLKLESKGFSEDKLQEVIRFSFNKMKQRFIKAPNPSQYIVRTEFEKDGIVLYFDEKNNGWNDYGFRTKIIGEHIFISDISRNGDNWSDWKYDHLYSHRLSEVLSTQN
jgi:FtsZ-binding cell division protein ZapB